MIERYLLRYFLAVVDHGNFSRAAAQCNVSQPTLSIGIAKLERDCGKPLFLRSNQRVELTEAGARLLAHARRIEREFNLAQLAMNDAAPKARLRIGLLHTIPGALSAAALAKSLDTDTTIELVPGTERELIAFLSRGRIDVAVTLLRPGADRFAQSRIMDEGYGLALAASHRLADRAQIAPEELSSEVMIVRQHCEALSETSRYFTERGVRPHFAFRSTNDERVVQMVAAGLGVTVMPDSYRHPAMRQIRLAGFDARRVIGFQYAHGAEHLKHEPTPILEALAETIAAPEASSFAI